MPFLSESACYRFYSDHHGIAIRPTRRLVLRSAHHNFEVPLQFNPPNPLLADQSDYLPLAGSGPTPPPGTATRAGQQATTRAEDGSRAVRPRPVGPFLQAALRPAAVRELRFGGGPPFQALDVGLHIDERPRQVPTTSAIVSGSVMASPPWRSERG